MRFASCCSSCYETADVYLKVHSISSPCWYSCHELSLDSPSRQAYLREILLPLAHYKLSILKEMFYERPSHSLRANATHRSHYIELTSSTSSTILAIMKLLLFRAKIGHTIPLCMANQASSDNELFMLRNWIGSYSLPCKKGEREDLWHEDAIWQAKIIKRLKNREFGPLNFYRPAIGLNKCKANAIPIPWVFKVRQGYMHK